MRRIACGIFSALFFFQVGFGTEIPVNQYAPCWFIGQPTLKPSQPNQMIFETWTAAVDPYLQTFYRNIPSKSGRFHSVSPDKTFSIVPLMTFYASTTPTQWTPSLDTPHLFWDWNLLGDSFVYFGGADSQGQLVFPPAGLIRAAHQQGVPIYGTIFFSETSPGAWVESFVAKTENDTYPAVDQLLAMAQAYQLDGFFLNQESEEFTDNAAFIPFFSYFNQQAQILAQGNAPIKLVWYDLSYQPDTAFMKTESPLFLNYTWSQSSNEKSWVETAEVEKFALSNLQFGIDMENEGAYTFPGISSLVSSVVTASAQCQCGLFDVGQMVMQGQSVAPDLTTAVTLVRNFYEGAPAPSISIFVPRAFSSSAIRPVLAEKDTPRLSQTTSCVASTVAAYSSLMGDRFSSFFNLGQGNQFFVQGKVISAQPWWEPGLQDMSVVPQWAVPEKIVTAQITAGYNTQLAFMGGSSLNWTGALQLDNAVTYPLFHTKLSLEAGSQLQVSYLGGHKREEILLETTKGVEVPIKLTEEGKNWVTQSVILPETLEIKAIKIRFLKGEKSIAVNFNLGGISVGPAIEPTPEVPINLVAQGPGVGNRGAALLTWAPMEHAVSYEIRSFPADGSSVFVARVSTPAYYFSSLVMGVTLGVASVGRDGLASEYAKVLVQSELQAAIGDWEVL